MRIKSVPSGDSALKTKQGTAKSNVKLKKLKEYKIKITSEQRNHLINTI